MRGKLAISPQVWFANYESVLVQPIQSNDTAMIVETGTGFTHVPFPWLMTYCPRVQSNIIDWEKHRELAAPVDFYAGIRYAKLAQNYRAATDQGNAEASSQFRGLGPTVDLGINHLFPDPSFSMFANLRGSLLFGQKDYGGRRNMWLQ